MRKALFFLGILSDTDIDWLIAAGERQRIAANTVLIRHGEPIRVVYLVLDGTLRVTIDDREVAQLRSGEILGELSFVDMRPPSANVVAIEDSVVLAVAREPLAEKLENDTAFGYRFYRALAVLLADRVRSTTSRLAYGSPAATPSDELEDELEPMVLDRMALAGARFDWLLRRLRGY
jgi:bacteriocin-type transport-associated protein